VCSSDLPAFAEHEFETAQILEVHVANGQNFLIHQPVTFRLTADCRCAAPKKPAGGKRRLLLPVAV